MEEIRDEAKKHLGGCVISCENWIKNVNDDVINNCLTFCLTENTQKFSSFSKVVTMGKELQDLSEYCRDLQIELEKTEKNKHTRISNSKIKRTFIQRNGTTEIYNSHISNRKSIYIQ